MDDQRADGGGAGIIRRGRRLELILALLIVGLVACWGAFTRNWIQKRHETLKWAWDWPNRVQAKGVVGIGEATTNRLPWTLQLWGESIALAYLEVDLNELPESERPRLDNLRLLFPEAEVQVRSLRELPAAKEPTEKAAG